MKHSLVLVAGLLLATVPGVTSRAGYPLNPNAKFRGKSFEQWNVLAAENGVKQFVGVGGSPNLTINKVRLLPEVLPPDSVGNVYVFDIVARPGTAFCVPAAQTQRELYDNGLVDDPLDLETIYAATTMVPTILNSNVLLEGTIFQFPDFIFGPAS